MQQDSIAYYIQAFDPMLEVADMQVVGMPDKVMQEGKFEEEDMPVLGKLEASGILVVHTVTEACNQFGAA